MVPVSSLRATSRASREEKRGGAIAGDARRGPRRPRFSVKWLFNDNGDSQIDNAIGGYLPLLDFRRPSAPDEEWQVAGFAGVWARFDTRENLDEIGEDFRVGLSLSYRKDPGCSS